MFRSVIVALVFLFVLAACAPTAAPTPSTSDTPVPSASASSTTAPAPSTAARPTVAELSRAVVYIEAIDTEGRGYSGSGTLISNDGLILTNAHVAAPFDDGREYNLSVGLTTDAGTVPEPSFAAQLLTADAALDLALIKITSTLDGSTRTEPFPFLPIGDSDSVQIGEEVHILGYPSIGGDTITYTRGQISGFTGDSLLGERAWIKTDATIAGGNSGGLAANLAGELIAVPTQASATTDGPLVDCRIITDTNGDGSVTEADTCVPIGGFLNGLRPAIFANDMIAAVETGTAYEPIGGLTQPDEEQPEYTAEDVLWTTATMTTDVDAETNEAVDRVETMPSGSNQLCAVWSYEGMQPGMDYDAVWMIDGEIDTEISYLSQTWAFEDEGNFWICTYTEDGASLAEGFYVAAIVVEGEQQASGWTYVGDDYAPVDWSLLNTSTDTTFCYVYVSPVEAPGWGPDRLGAEETMAPGAVLELNIPPGEYDVMVRDCDRETLFEEVTTVTADGHIELGGD